MLKEPLTNERARALLREILSRRGVVSFSNHALDEMAKDELTSVDAQNVLRGGVVEFSEKEQGTWRYRVRTARMTFVVAFRSETSVRVVTAWRHKR